MNLNMLNLLHEGVIILTLIMNMILILLGVAFNTLLERKVLGYIQLRKGPNKVGFMGIFQPFGDAIKLYTNEITNVGKINLFYFFMSPMFMLLMMLLIWIIIPILNESMLIESELLFIFCCLAVGTYPLILAGWSSYSNYALIGAIRAVSQMISYEVMMILIIMSIILFNESYSLIFFFKFQEINKYMIMMFIISLMFFLSMLAELNRSPFDLVEGESELVSGFNIEYSSGPFGMIFMAEYGMIMFSSFFYLILFLGISLTNFLFYFLFAMMNFIVIWIRGVLPRIRYDELMMICWKHFLLVVLVIFYYNLVIKLILDIYFYLDIYM